MGRRGPPKTPAATLKHRGTFRKDRHSDDVDKLLEVTVPPPPDHFDENAKALWNRLGQQLAEKGLVTELDSMALELLVASYLGMRSVTDTLADQDLVYFTESGAPIANPLIGIIGKNVALLKWALREFGCTPSARTGIKVTPPKKPSLDPMAKLLGDDPGPPRRTPAKRKSKPS